MNQRDSTDEKAAQAMTAGYVVLAITHVMQERGHRNMAESIDIMGFAIASMALAVEEHSQTLVAEDYITRLLTRTTDAVRLLRKMRAEKAG